MSIFLGRQFDLLNVRCSKSQLGYPQCAAVVAINTTQLSVSSQPVHFLL